MIKIENVTKIFNRGKSNEKIALSGFSAEIADGEMVAIMGASGAGKSTLMNILGSLDSPTEGSVSVDGKILETYKDKELADYRCHTVGIVTQYPFLIENLSAMENVSVPLLSARVNKKERTQRVVAMLKNLGLDTLMYEKVRNMSGGERQRVVIARALINNPTLILADEPTGSLDIENSEKIFSVFKKINDSGKMVIIITHNAEIAEKCSRKIVLSDGKIISDSKKTI